MEENGKSYDGAWLMKFLETSFKNWNQVFSY